MLNQLALDNYSTVAKIGRAWFRWRSFSPVPLFLLLVLLPAEFTPSSIQVSLAILGVVLAEGLRIWSVGYAGSATRTRGESVPELVHAGPYRYLRNPLYVANIALYTCAGVLFGFRGLSILIFLVSAVEYIFIVAFEEETLARIFGASYHDYCEKVPRWFPSFETQMPKSSHEFSLLKALRSEKSTFLSLAGMALLYVIKQTL